jgi:nucleotide-binding universal stress UspA family protein
VLTRETAGVPQDYDPHAAGHELLESIRPLIERHSVATGLLVRSGDPAAEIERVADELRADAVVVGASTKAGRTRRLCRCSIGPFRERAGHSRALNARAINRSGVERKRRWR